MFSQLDFSIEASYPDTSETQGDSDASEQALRHTKIGESLNDLALFMLVVGSVIFPWIIMPILAIARLADWEFVEILVFSSFGAWFLLGLSTSLLDRHLNDAWDQEAWSAEFSNMTYRDLLTCLRSTTFLMFLGTWIIPPILAFTGHVSWKTVAWAIFASSSTIVIQDLVFCLRQFLSRLGQKRVLFWTDPSS